MTVSRLINEVTVPVQYLYNHQMVVPVTCIADLVIDFRQGRFAKPNPVHAPGLVLALCSISPVHMLILAVVLGSSMTSGHGPVKLSIMMHQPAKKICLLQLVEASSIATCTLRILMATKQNMRVSSPGRKFHCNRSFGKPAGQHPWRHEHNGHANTVPISSHEVFDQT